MTKQTTAIVLKNVSKSFVTPPSYVIKHLSLTVQQGEFFCLIGPSGCGKSTVIKLIAGIEKPSSGTVHRASNVGMVFQSYALLPWLTVEHNVAFAPRMLGLSQEKVAKATKKYLQMVHMETFAQKFPRELSGGQRQRVGIARALASESDILLMDEPFSALDPVITDKLHDDILQIWQETKKTIFMISHNFDEAVYLADRIGVLQDGKLTKIFAVNLPRPRTLSNPKFAGLVHKIRDFLELQQH